MLIPEGPLTEWAYVEGTTTAFADPVVHFGTRCADEAAYSDLFIAFPVSALPSFTCIRIDFISVLRDRFSSENLSKHEGGRGYLGVVDGSEFKEASLAEAEFGKFYRGGHELEMPEQVFRHFRITFDHYGRFDILARSARTRTFESRHDGSGSQFERHSSVLQEALLLGPIE